MVRAITGIDEELINDAHTVRKARVIPWSKLGTLAAGLVLIVSAAFLLKPGGEVRITVSGQELSARAVRVDEEALGAVPRAYSLDPATVFTVPLEVEVREYTVISVLSGTMQVFDSEGNRLLYEGETFGAKDSINILWTVETDKTADRFEMSLESAESAHTVILTYDGGEWRIRRGKNDGS